ncbi:3-hydroxyacyl-ACP dehydratase FabZ [Oricola cellulosilytica]|uniref:3-hydroxyacyl-[acyl-carrier-protein] dehydratase FabZ n=1 Tax=Oricola cellulosilytica TaxID=1429082 RepID=A0A4R0PAI9_9HYPH|nr:3-hydroxyacyl-ACP dehydratase FabZ [Oricola cellulosilytica]TCD13207.1 3-hydroxyacyl-ACP dehydratase FabZ [Oricola cellulosilytica]
MSSTAAPDTTLESVDLLEIMELLPHRYPFLLIDRIVDIESDKSAVGIKNVTANEPHFQGHFPGRPIMPGVLMIEGMAQTAGAIGIRALGLDKPALVYFMTIDNAKFRRPVVPGDVVEYHVKLVKKRGTVCRYACVAMVGSEKVAEAEVAAMLSPDDAEG